VFNSAAKTNLEYDEEVNENDYTSTQGYIKSHIIQPTFIWQKTLILEMTTTQPILETTEGENLSWLKNGPPFSQILNNCVATEKSNNCQMY